MANIKDFEIVMGQLCFTESVLLLRDWFPNAATSVFILMPNLRLDAVFPFASCTSLANGSQCRNDLSSDIAFRESAGYLTHPNPASETDFAFCDTTHIIGFDFTTTRSSSPGFLDAASST